MYFGFLFCICSCLHIHKCISVHMYTEPKDNLRRHFLGSVRTVFVDRVSHGLRTCQLPPKSGICLFLLPYWVLQIKPMLARQVLTNWVISPVPKFLFTINEERCKHGLGCVSMSIFRNIYYYLSLSPKCF